MDDYSSEANIHAFYYILSLYLVQGDIVDNISIMKILKVIQNLFNNFKNFYCLIVYIFSLKETKFQSEKLMYYIRLITLAITYWVLMVE